VDSEGFFMSFTLEIFTDLWEGLKLKGLIIVFCSKNLKKRGGSLKEGAIQLK